ncbi:hypothetical protein NDU88_004677 [Pleurodeles waltl]|uniref:Uncharacterized protein n=1 Tax=Pleurodeles waltl TaxID=8319 RepID=A0AAV7TSL8_PLEWA|nr:hypothetical protein NDU88_004677 [Pleurodeles waltl]
MVVLGGWGAYVKKTLGNLRLKDLWVKSYKDTVGLIKDKYWELTLQAYLDMLYPELKRTLYMKYRLGVLPLRGYLVRIRRLAVGLEFSDCTPGEVDNVAHFTLACKKFD